MAILVFALILGAWTIEAKAYWSMDIPEREESRGCE